MAIMLSARDVQALQLSLQTAHSPFAFPDLNAWRERINACLMEMVETDRASFILHAPTITEPAYSVGFSDQYVSDYLIHYQYIDHASRLMKERPLPVFSTEIVARMYDNDWQWYHRSAIYNEFYRPHEVEDCIGVLLSPTIPTQRLIDTTEGKSWDALGPALLLWSANHARFGTELFGEKGTFLMQLIQPALQASLEAFFAVTTQRSALVQSLDLMSEAAWLCSRSGRLLHENAAMRRLLTSDPERARLRAYLQREVYALSSLLDVRRGRLAGQALQAGTRSVRTGAGTYRVRGSILEGAFAEWDTAPAMIVILERPSSGFPTAAELMEAFGLTRQEARVALMLAERKRNGEIAETLVISPHTARRHTQGVLAKLGVESRDQVASAISGGRGVFS